MNHQDQTAADQPCDCDKLEPVEVEITTDPPADCTEELAAKLELAKITPRNADLLRLADRFPAPQAWYDE